MKKYWTLIIIFSVFACSNAQNKELEKHNSQEIKSDESEIKPESNTSEIRNPMFKETKMQGILIGSNIELLNNELKVIGNISNLSGDIVNITGVSDSLYNLSKDICDSFWYVKIKGNGKEGIVDGRQVFKIVESNQDTSFIFKNYDFRILTTDFLGLGVEYQGDLMGCPVDQPVLIKDFKNDFLGLVKLKPNEYSRKANWDNEYPYFELRNDDGTYDKIDSISTDGTKIRLKIHRTFQEGENDYEVQLSFANDKYTAEYLSYGEIEYK